MPVGFNIHHFLKTFSAEASEQGFTQHTLVDLSTAPLLAWCKPGKLAPIYLSAGIHGDEPAGPLALLELMQSGYFKTDHHWIICPALNPNGLFHQQRTNHEGIDLNRDYLSLRSNEITAHAKWLQTQPIPSVFLSFHEDWESTGFYYYEIQHPEGSMERYSRILEAVAPWFPPEPAGIIDDHTVRAPGWIDHPAQADAPDEWPEAIYLAQMGCPLSLTLETPSQAPLADRVAAHVAAAKVARSL